MSSDDKGSDERKEPPPGEVERFEKRFTEDAPPPKRKDTIRESPKLPAPQAPAPPASETQKEGSDNSD
jgi:hypothetical protein